MTPATAIILAIALTLLFAAPLGKGIPLAQASVENTPATGLPTINGTVQVGETLMADTSNIADEDGLEEVSFTYQWLAGDADISGAAGSTYTLANTDEGKTVKVQVSFTDDADNEEILTSGATDAVAAVGARAQQLCSGGGYDPAPTKVEVEGVPIVVESTIDEYFVLYVRYDLDADSTVYLPVSVTLGQAGATTLSENVAALPKERYQVHKYLVADPADVDGDCIDDITELADPVGRNPVNPAAAIALSSGALAVPDRDTFEALSRQRLIESRPGDWEYLRFVLFDMETGNPGVYFMNTSSWEVNKNHREFLEAQGIEWDRVVRGVIAYNQNPIAPNGSQGIYSYWLKPFNFSYAFSLQERSYRLLAASLPLLNDDLALYIQNDELPYSQTNLPLYEDARINVVFDEDMYSEVDFQALNTGEGYGLLRVRDPDDRPHPREIVVYEALPHELPRVAGIITTAPQTPLSHINLRAVQDGVPNAFIRDALDNPDIDSLLDNYVHYTVTEGGWTLRAATPAEVEAHYAASRPATEQTPQRDLSVTEITALGDIEFDDWTAFGVKAANVAVLRTLGFPGGTVPDGFAVPFYFYDEFMKHNGFYDDIEEMLADSEFQSDFDTQESKLKKLRKKIKKGDTPEWINTALTEMHAAYPEGQSLRYRSSTNNEDLPGFNGAGLYDSKTQHPEETEEHGIAKSLKQVFASLWNFRAFSEREFHRIDHLEAAMGVLVHPNYSDELANGVAVSFDPIDARDDVYYVNTQIGEDLVTNPEAHSVPEEILLYRGTSNQVPPGQLLLTTYQMTQLRRHLEVIHDDFKELYNPGSSEPFAMEIEFKITSENILAIKQARPWVFSVPSARPAANSPATGAPTISGTAQVGKRLMADTTGIADADGITNVSYTYQWMADNADISGATGISYTLVQADESNAITVQVSFTDDAGNEEELTSEATGAVLTRPNSPATGAPAIIGTAQVGETFAADTSGINDADGLTDVGFSYQWIRNDGTTDTDISGATGETYTLLGADQGKSIKVRVSFTDDVGNEETLTSAPTGPVFGDGPPGAPRNLTISAGDRELTLSWEPPADNGNAPATRYRIEWRIDGKDYKKGHWGTAGKTTYTKTDLANGVKYVFRVKAENGNGNSYGPYGPASEEVSGTPMSGSAVDLGTPVLLDTENLHHGMVTLDWEDIEDAGWYVVQYYHIDGGNGEWLDLPAVGVDIAFHGSSAVVSDLHGLSWLRVRAMSCAGASEWSQIEQLFGTNASDWEGVPVPDVAEGDEIEPCPEDPDTPGNSPATGTPAISGTARVGEVLEVNTSGIADEDGLTNATYSFQWLADNTEIAGATSFTYTLVAEDEGKVIKVEVSFTDDAGNGETLTSGATDAVAAARPNSLATGAPTISGTVQVGETLTPNTSGIADADGLDDVSFTYQWLADDSGISGATNATYTLAAADEGKAIKVRVSFTDDAGNDESLTSAATAAVAAAGPSEPPDRPRGLSATATHDSVTLTWDDPGDDSITGYVILRRVRVNNEGGEFSVLVPDTGSAAATYTDDTVAAGTTYTYRIKAINGAGTSERSRWFHIDIPAAPVPDKPTGLSATATHDSVTLTWNDPGDDSVTGYVVLRRLRYDDPKGHFDELAADTGTAATTYTDDTVEANTNYTYRIKAINGAGTSERSRWSHIDTPAAP